MPAELCFDTDNSSEDIVRFANNDRETLIEQVLELYESLRGRLPAELVADVIFDVCDWGIARRDLLPGQNAYCDFSTRRIFISRSLSSIALKKRLDHQSFKRTILAHELGHIRLHGSEMDNREFRSYLGPGLGYDDSRRDQRENEAELYAAIFLVPWSMLGATEQAARLQEALREGLKLTSKEVTALNLSLATQFCVTPNLMSRALEAYEWVERARTRRVDVFHLSLKKKRLEDSPQD